MGTGLTFIIHGLKSLPVKGRKKVTFHLDQLVMFQRQPVDGRFFWMCRMAEVDPHTFRSGIACDGHGLNFDERLECEEDALMHIQTVHRGMGGTKLAKGRGKARREREIERWKTLKGVKNGNGSSDD